MGSPSFLAGFLAGTAFSLFPLSRYRIRWEKFYNFLPNPEWPQNEEYTVLKGIWSILSRWIEGGGAIDDLIWALPWIREAQSSSNQLLSSNISRKFLISLPLFPLFFSFLFWILLNGLDHPAWSWPKSWWPPWFLRSKWVNRGYKKTH